MSRIFVPQNPIPPNGKLYFYEPGAASTTDKTVYSDKALTIALAQPVVAADDGEIPEIHLNGNYAVKCDNSLNVQQWRVNEYEPASTDSQFDDWSALFTYNINDFARGSNGKYYQSLVSSNINNDPTTSEEEWVEKFFQDVWNQFKTYPIDEIVVYQGDQWVSTQAGNTGNTPSASSDFWRSFFIPSTATDYTAASFEYRNADGFNVTQFDLTGTVAESTFESIGPTGSGADNIWTAMDDLPDDAKFVIFICEIDFRRSSASDEFVNCSVRARAGGGSATIAQCEVISKEIYGGTTPVNAIINDKIEVTVPLDSNQIFDINWAANEDNGGTGIDLILSGYKV